MTAAIDWCHSNTLEIEVIPDGRQVFEVGSNISVWGLLFVLLYVTIWKARYLYLREADPEVASWLE